MKKSEIIQLALIILGVSIIARTFETIAGQISMNIGHPDGLYSMYPWLLSFVSIMTILILIGYLIIKKSSTISKKIIKDESDLKVEISLNRSEIIHISIVIISLLYIVKLFPSFISAVYMIILNFFDDYTFLKDIFPQQIWSIILYITIFVILINSNKFSIWLERKIMK